ncbi:MAG: hypothetical protein ACREU8_00245, partial [Gammaproteobacteria bacterium]
QWFTDEYRTIKEQARRWGAPIFFLERTSVGAVLQQGDRIAHGRSSVDVQWMAGGRGEWAFMAFPDGIGLDEVIEFFERLLRQLQSRVVIVGRENAAYCAPCIRQWLERRSDQIVLETVPL